MPRPSTSYANTVFLMGLVTILACSVAVAEEKPAAQVNGAVITEPQLAQELMSRHGYAVLETMIEALAIRQQATARGISVTAEQVEARYQEERRKIVSSAREPRRSASEIFAIWLAQRNLNRETFRQQVELQLLLEKMVEDEIEVTDQEVARFYESNQKQLERPELVQVSHITVTTKEEAERIRQEILESKTTFEQAARDYSLDTYGRENGGLLPPMGRGELSNEAWEPVRTEAFKLKADGEISHVFQTHEGWDILRREAYQKGGTPPFEEIQEQLTNQLYQARLAQAAQEMRTAIMKIAKVERIIQFPSVSEAVGEVAAESSQ